MCTHAHTHTHTIELHITQVCVCVCHQQCGGNFYIRPTNFVMMRIFLNEILCGIFSQCTLFRLLAVDLSFLKLGGRGDHSNGLSVLLCHYRVLWSSPLPSESSVG